jgi:hypothetical protein
LEEQASEVQRAANAATGLTDVEVVALRNSLHAVTGSLRAAASR